MAAAPYTPQKSDISSGVPVADCGGVWCHEATAVEYVHALTTLRRGTLVQTRRRSPRRNCNMAKATELREVGSEAEVTASHSIMLCVGV